MQGAHFSCAKSKALRWTTLAQCGSGVNPHTRCAYPGLHPNCRWLVVGGRGGGRVLLRQQAGQGPRRPTDHKPPQGATLGPPTFPLSHTLTDPRKRDLARLLRLMPAAPCPRLSGLSTTEHTPAASNGHRRSHHISVPRASPKPRRASRGPGN